ncbi:MAG: VanZ family protein [Pirellulaceae bacterium]|nr:VanZ family protein [Pirellulaceae bacterium]
MPASSISPATRRFWQALALGYLACLSWMLLTPNPWILFGSPGQQLAEQVQSALADHFQHAAAFLFLALLCQLALRGTRGGSWQVMTAWLLGYALVVEGSHAWIPNRYFEWSDLLANMTGAMTGMLLAGLLLRSPGPPDA